MEIKCPKCRSLYRISAAKIPNVGTYVKCEKCQARFFLKKEPKDGKKCSKCGYQRQPKDDVHTSLIECPKCAAIYEKVEDKDSDIEEIPKDIEWKARILCDNGNCFGALGSNGRCKKCGKAFMGDIEPHTPDITKKPTRTIAQSTTRVSTIEKRKIYEEERIRAEARKEAEKEIKAKETASFLKGCFGCFGVIIVISVVVSLCTVLTTDHESSRTSTYSSCYDLGYQYGRCAAMAMQGNTCDPADDIVIPENCKGKKETQQGIEDGMRSVLE